MARVTTQPPFADDQPASPAGPSRRPTVTEVASAAETVAFAALVATTGSDAWRAVRLLSVAGLGAALVWLQGRRVALVRPAALAVPGVLGVTAGAGVGVMHVAKSDVDGRAIAGLFSLVAGLVLLATSAVHLWRATPGWWRLLSIPVAAFVTVEFALIPLTVAIYGTNLPATRLSSTTPAEQGFTYQDVNLTTTDHVRLSAWYIPSRNGAAVVVLHGSGSTRTSILNQAEVVARHGYGVLLFDARGHGRSSGAGMDFGWWGDRDIAAAITWLAARPDVTGGRIAAVGISMGGEEALGGAATDPRVRAVVTEGALWRGFMDTSWLPRTPQGYVERGMLAVQTAVINLLTSAPEPISLRRAVVAIAPRPVLLIAGKPGLRGDRQLRDAAPGSVELWELPDTPHVGGLVRHPAEWEARVIGFLTRVLPPPTR